MMTIATVGLSAVLATFPGLAPNQGTVVKPTTPSLTVPSPGPAAAGVPLHSQPWREPSGSFDSAVMSCEITRPHKAVALDDWIARVNSPITRIEWWGWTQDPVQLKRPFWIAIRKHNPATNKPEMGAPPLWKVCMVPTLAGQVGKDCHGNPVYKFTAKFVAPFFYQKVGQHYWLQISEADKESAQVDRPNFGWSASRPIRFSPAVQHAVTGAWRQPLIDPCPPKDRVDLAFVLWRV